MSVSHRPDASDDETPDEIDDSDKISVLQIVAATGASTTAALVANLLGVMGTVIGVGVISVISSLGTVLYLRSMKRTGRRIKQVVQHVPTPLRHPAPTTPTLDSSTPPLPRSDDDTLVDMEPVLDLAPAPVSEPAVVAPVFPWKRFALSTVAVFALSIITLTVVAVAAGNPPATYWNEPKQTTVDGDERPNGTDEAPPIPPPSDPSDEPSPTADSPSPAPTSPVEPSDPTPSDSEPTSEPSDPVGPEPSEPDIEG